MSLSACTKIRHMLRRWRHKSSNVPAGHVAISVGARRRRFVVRTTYLNHPVFRKLLVEAEEEYGFSNTAGPLAIPCEESVFEEILRFLQRTPIHNVNVALDDLEDFHRYSRGNLREPLLYAGSHNRVRCCWSQPVTFFCRRRKLIQPFRHSCRPNWESIFRWFNPMQFLNQFTEP